MAKLFNFLNKSTDDNHLHIGALTSSQLKNEKLKSEIVINSIADGVVLVDQSFTTHLFNPAAATITGWRQEDAIGLNIHNTINLVDNKGKAYGPEENPFDIVFKTGKPITDSTAFLTTHGGKQLAVSITVSPIAPEPGKTPSTVVGVFRDITKEKEDEARRTEFISTASHEMRTPIAAIEGYLSLAMNEKVTHLDPQARSYLEKAHNSVQHLGALFQDLLTSTKVEDGRLANYPAVVEMGELIEQVSDAAKFNAQKKGLTMTYSFGTAEGGATKTVRPLYYVFADPNRIREVVQNLLDNAVKYTMQGGITVAITGDLQTVQVQIRDTGQGIPPDDIPHLFQKFYRVDSSLTRTVGGTGLGLFISKKIVEMSNGKIWLDSKIGSGSIFYINLPRLSAARAAELAQKQSSQVAALDNPAMGVGATPVDNQKHDTITSS